MDTNNTPVTDAAEKTHEQWRWLGYVQRAKLRKPPNGWEHARALEAKLAAARTALDCIRNETLRDAIPNRILDTIEEVAVKALADSDPKES